MFDSESIISIDKPTGWTSFDVVAKIRNTRRTWYRQRELQPTKRQLKVGHAGTLDPFATGLLIILLGESTKRSDEFLKLDKTYEATIHLGATSTTGDPEGVITASEDLATPPSGQEVHAALRKLTGEITQRPPAFSAIKVGGQRAYKLARAGKEVDVPPRHVTIYTLDVVEYTYPELIIRTRVSSGTYIRTLAEDIGASLGTGGYCKQLRRTAIGDFMLEDAQSIEQAVDRIEHA